VLPELRTTSPRIDDHLVHLASALAEDERWFSSELRRTAVWIDPWLPDGSVALEAISAMPKPIRTRWLHAQSARAGIGPVSRRQLELFHELVTTGVPRSVTLSARWRIRRVASRLWLEPPVFPEPYDLPLADGLEVPLTIPGWRIRVSRGDETGQPEKWTATVSSTAHLSVRTPQPGDRVTRGEHQVKVADLIARAAPRHLRTAWPLLCENANIAWIPGVWQGPCKGNLLVEVLTDG
jgi:hypothetical protein